MKDEVLHVFANDVTDWVIAYNPEDAKAVYTESTGMPYNPEEDGGEFEQESDAKVLTIYEDKTTTPQPKPAHAIVVQESEYHHTYTATCRAWADARGRCFLCSTEY